MSVFVPCLCIDEAAKQGQGFCVKVSSIKIFFDALSHGIDFIA